MVRFCCVVDCFLLFGFVWSVFFWGIRILCFFVGVGFGAWFVFKLFVFIS